MASQILSLGAQWLLVLLAPLVFSPLALVSRRAAPYIAICLLAVPLGFTVGTLPFIAMGIPVVIGSRDLVWLALKPVSWFKSALLFRIDVLSWLMLFIITFVGMLIFIYSIRYMEHDPHVRRFWLYMLLFAGSMIGVVTANDIFLLFLFWEITTLSSFGLIGHWIEREQALFGSVKALLLTGFGGLVMAVGLFVLMYATGTNVLSDALKMAPLADKTLVSLSAALILIGILAKSAQFPFFTWLPDAMEAPTPVSAFLHSAAMVKAGVYLYARLIPLYALNPVISAAALTLFALTALIGAMYATIESNAKRVLAYSTVSQLGYMLSAFALASILQAFGYTELAGIAMVAGMLHLLNHAIFKAGLFLATGAVEHEVGTKDLDEMGGLIRHMRKLAAGFTILVCGLVGVPLFNGFVSKWLIYQSLIGSLTTGVVPALLIVALAILLFGTALTAAYGFRMIYGIFFGMPPRPSLHAFEPQTSMLAPILILAGGVLFLGIWPNVAIYLFAKCIASPYPLPPPRMADFILIPVALPSYTTSISLIYVAILFGIALLIGFGGFLVRARPRVVAEPFIGGEDLSIVVERGVPKAKIKSESFFLEVAEVFRKVRTKVNPDAAYLAIGKAFDAVSKGLRALEAGHLVLYLWLIIIGVIILLALI